MSKIRDAISDLEESINLLADPADQKTAFEHLDTIISELDEIENELGAIISEYESQIDVAKKLKDKVY